MAEVIFWLQSRKPNLLIYFNKLSVDQQTYTPVLFRCLKNLASDIASNAW
jgi:hypothetical protein